MGDGRICVINRSRCLRFVTSIARQQFQPSAMASATPLDLLGIIVHTQSHATVRLLLSAIAIRIAGGTGRLASKFVSVTHA